MKVHTEAETSSYVDIQEQGRAFRMHVNDAGSGAAVVFIHGMGPGASGWSNFSRNVDPFVAAGYRVLVPDCGGFNKSDPLIPSETRGQINARMIHAALDAKGIDKVFLIGNSMGGGTALHFALDYPDRVNKMLLMGPGGVGHSLFAPMPMEGIKLIFQVYREPTLDNVRRLVQVFIHDKSLITEELIQQRFEALMRYPEHISNMLQGPEMTGRGMRDLSPELHRIQTPTLVTWGRDDRFVPLDNGLKLIWGLPNAELHVFSQCGHWAQWEHAERFNRLAIDFFS